MPSRIRLATSSVSVGKLASFTYQTPEKNRGCEAIGHLPSASSCRFSKAVRVLSRPIRRKAEGVGSTDFEFLFNSPPTWNPPRGPLRSWSSRTPKRQVPCYWVGGYYFLHIVADHFEFCFAKQKIGVGVCLWPELTKIPAMH